MNEAIFSDAAQLKRDPLGSETPIMADSAYAELFELFSAPHQDTSYRVLFLDGDDYDLKGIFAAKDPESPAHADGMVIRCRRGDVAPGGALFFRLGDVHQVLDAETGQVVYAAA